MHFLQLLLHSSVLLIVLYSYYYKIKMTQSIDVKQAYINAGQEHLFRHWDKLSQEEQVAFIEQLSKLQNPAKFLNDVQTAIQFSSTNSASRNLSCLPASSYSSTLDAKPQTLQNWTEHGFDLLKESKVGVILMAGGQGTRLGSSDPKGCYDVGLPSHKSLFQIQSERILKLQKLTESKFNLAENSVTIPLYIMTSAPTRVATEAFFSKNNYFGLKKENIVFFNQGVLPAVSLDGSKLILESTSKIVESPDGNGGLYKALSDNKIVEDFQKRGVEHVHMYCVDNILVKVADPVFVGYSAVHKYDIATKVVRKRNASESVGLIVLDEDLNAPCVVEYSEISKELSEKTDADGKLHFRAANIVNHYYNVDYLNEMIPSWISSRRHLPYHIAKKKIGVLENETGKFTKPEKPNGIKMEQFIFDVFPSVSLNKFGCLEVERSDEFSPLKNAPGSLNDSPETCKLNSLKRGTQWIVENGGILENEDGLVEVSPSASYAGEGLENVQGKIFKDGDIV